MSPHEALKRFLFRLVIRVDSHIINLTFRSQKQTLKVKDSHTNHISMYYSEYVLANEKKKQSLCFVVVIKSKSKHKRTNRAPKRDRTRSNYETKRMHRVEKSLSR